MTMLNIEYKGTQLRAPVFGAVDDIFNQGRNYQEEQPLFFADRPGIVDTINLQHEEMWTNYDKLRLLDWKETEFDFKSCQQEFESLKESESEVAMLTLGWQWEADSVAAHSVMPILSLYFPAEALFVLYQRIGDNESIHALTYARIQKQAFVNAQAAMDRVLQLKQPFQRLKTVAEVFANAKYVGHLLQLGMLRKEDYVVREALFLFLVALYCLERVQFMGSFSITHSTVEIDMLVPIGDAVRKIAMDEYGVHVPTVRWIIANLLQSWGAEVMLRSRPAVVRLLNEVRNAEEAWTHFTFSEGRGIAGTGVKRVVQQINHCATDPMLLLGLNRSEVEFDPIITNPHPTFENWLDINNAAKAAQETRGSNYLNGGVTNHSRDGVILTALGSL